MSDLEAENDTLKAENIKLRNEIPSLKGKPKLTKKTFDDKLNTSIAKLQLNDSADSVVEGQPQDQQKDDCLLTFPAEVKASNSFSALQDNVPCISC